MKTVTDTNGTVRTYDNTLQKGDLITADSAGYYIFERYADRPGKTPIAHYRHVYLYSGKSYTCKDDDFCDAYYCQRADEHVRKAIESRLKEIKALFDMAEANNIKI